MDSWKLNEPVVQALVDRLETDLPTELEAIRDRVTAAGPAADAEFLNAALEDPVQVLDYAPPPSHLDGGLPAVGILDRDSRIDDDTGSSATGHHVVGIVVYVAAAEHRQLAWALRRYAQAITRVALAGRRLGTSSDDGAWGITGQGVSWGDTFEDADDPRSFLSYIIVWVAARREELE